MAEHRYAVQTYRIDYRCDACTTPLRFTGMTKPARLVALPGRGDLHQHRCPGCEAVTWLERTYPATEYEPVLEVA